MFYLEYQAVFSSSLKLIWFSVKIMEDRSRMILVRDVSPNPSLINHKNKDQVLISLKSLATSHLHSVQMNDIIEVFSQPSISPYLFTTIQAISILIHHSHPGPDWPQLREQCRNAIQFLQDLWRINEMPEDLPENLIIET